MTVHKCPHLTTGGNGEYRCRAVEDTGGYYSESYLGDHPNKHCKGDYLQCATFQKKYKEGMNKG
jgi:hypothetical protein